MINPALPTKTNRANAHALLSFTTRARRLRIPRIEITTHPVLVGNRNYLRALRAAEMAAWEAGLRFQAGE